MRRATYLLVLLLFVGCAHQRVQQRLAEIERVVEPLLGSEVEQVVARLGPPTAERSAGGMMIFDYYRSYGQRGTVFAPPGSLATVQTWSAYDRITLVFNSDGVLVRWDAYVQR